MRLSLKLIFLLVIQLWALVAVALPLPEHERLPVYQLNKAVQTITHYQYRHNAQADEGILSDIASLNERWVSTQLKQGDLKIKPGHNLFAFTLKNSMDFQQAAYLSLSNQVRILQADLYTEVGKQHTYPHKIQLQRIKMESDNTLQASIMLPANSEMQVVLHINSAAALRSSLTLFNQAGQLEEKSQSALIQGIGLGGLSCLTVAMLLLYIASGNSIVLVLFSYLLSRTLILSAFLGVTVYYFFPQYPQLRGVEVPLLMTASTVLLLLFTQKFFNLAKTQKKALKVIRLIIWLLVIYIPLSLLIPAAINVNLMMVCQTLSLLLLAIFGFYLHRKQHRLALLYSITMTIKLLSIVLIISAVNWVDIGFAQHKAIFFILLFWFDAFLLTFILSRQYYYIIKDKQHAQQHALTLAESSEQAQEQLLKLQQENQEHLEQRVQERTLELNIALQELEEANQELERKNILDELTGLHNRRYYDQKIMAEYRRSKRNLTPLSLVVLDIDHFKQVNDTYGHLAGDECIKWLSAKIKQSLKRSADLAFRYGGEEFCLILPDTETQGAYSLAENLREYIDDHAFNFDGKTIPLTISCGVCTYQQHEHVLPEQIFAGADAALYQAKQQGRNQTKITSLDTNASE